MASIKSDPKTRPPSVGENGGEDETVTAEHVDALRRVGQNGKASEVIKHMDLMNEAAERMKEAGRMLKNYVLGSTDGEIWDVFSMLSDAQKECIAMAGSLRSIEAIVTKRAREHERMMEEYRRKNLKRVKYPSVSRRSFDLLDAEPASPRGSGVVSEGRS